jgi:hypothetical protein
MVLLSKSNIPEYLTFSDLYENIESDEPFEILDEYYENNININSIDELNKYLKIFDFWLVNKTPNEIYKWIFDNKEKINID